MTEPVGASDLHPPIVHTGPDCAWCKNEADTPVRQESAHGEPPPLTSITRTCKTCGASFIGLAPGRTGLRGIWDEWKWYCSVECYGGEPDE